MTNKVDKNRGWFCKIKINECRNLNPGLATKARGCKVASQEGSPGIMLHSPGSAREGEGIGPHTPEGTPTLGIRVSVDSQMFKERL